MKINDCPFCNEEKDGGDVLDIGHMAFCVHCTNCQCYGPKEKSKELAIEKWNKAAGKSRLIALLILLEGFRNSDPDLEFSIAWQDAEKAGILEFPE